MITLSHCSPVRQNGPTCPTTPHTQRPPAITRIRFGLIRFRSPLLTEYLFLPVLRCFTSRRSLHIPYIFRYGSPHMTAAGFPHSDILGSRFACQLPEAYRRLLRPSSAPSAKASTLCSYKLPTTKTKYKDARVHCAVLKQRPATTEQPPPHQRPHQQRQDHQQVQGPDSPQDPTTRVLPQDPTVCRTDQPQRHPTFHTPHPPTTEATSAHEAVLARHHQNQPSSRCSTLEQPPQARTAQKAALDQPATTTAANQPRSSLERR